MLTLCLRTDKPVSELHLYKSGEEVASIEWEAHRELANTIHIKIEELLKRANNRLGDIEKIIVYKGPGSFTGLRIGISVANALAYGLDVSIVGATGEEWLVQGLADGANNTDPIQPHYGREPHITEQKK